MNSTDIDPPSPSTPVSIAPTRQAGPGNHPTRESAAALGEIHSLRQRCGDERQRAAVDDLAAMLEQCAGTPGSYLWFQGDWQPVVPLLAVMSGIARRGGSPGWCPDSLPVWNAPPCGSAFRSCAVRSPPGGDRGWWRRGGHPAGLRSVPAPTVAPPPGPCPGR